MRYCVICGERSHPAKALIIGGQLLCACCEKAITAMKPDDPAYDFYTLRLRKCTGHIMASVTD